MWGVLQNICCKHKRLSGLPVHTFTVCLQELRKLVPRLREERLLQLKPAVLHNLLSEEGMITPAARLVSVLAVAQRNLRACARHMLSLITWLHHQHHTCAHTCTPVAGDAQVQLQRSASHGGCQQRWQRR